MKSNISIYSYILPFIIIILNPWTVRLFQETSSVNIVLIFLIVFALFAGIIQSSKRFFYFAILINIFLIFFTLSKHFDTGVSTHSKLDKNKLIRIYDSYASGTGKLYMNRYGIMYHYRIEPMLANYEENLFENMDVNGYFFASHPRERGGFNEYPKFYGIFLPFFLIGLFSCFINNKKIFLLFVGNLLLSSLYIYNSSPWQILLYAYFVLFISSGINICLKKYIHI